MSSTPPKRGQKRPSPQTPRGQPPPKASRPSSPTEMTGQTLQGRSAPLTTGDLPAIPPFQPRAGPSAKALLTLTTTIKINFLSYPLFTTHIYVKNGQLQLENWGAWTLSPFPASFSSRDS